MDKHVYAERRSRFLNALEGGVAVIPAAPVHIRNRDVEHDYRQDSDFFYLTGFDEPESVLLLIGPGVAGKDDRAAGPRTVLFVRRRDPERETWDGRRAGTEGAMADFGADEAYPIEELAERLPNWLADVRRVFYRFGEYPSFDEIFFAALRDVRRRVRTGVCAPSTFIDPAEHLHAARLIKSEPELATIAAAGEITRRAHLRAMQVARPGVYEYEVEAELMRVFRQAGAERPAYGSIVGSGPNATILHHRRNDRRMEEGDLLLIDAGAELDYYASDVTRTFPVGGRFTAPQRRLYELVLRAQEAAIAVVRPGVAFSAVHDAAVAVLNAGLVELGLIKGPVEEALKEKRYVSYYMHKTSHFLGMDVHDVGDYYQAGASRTLEPGIVLTVEPGLYVAEDAQDAPAEYRGIGIRIEDDIAVTADGHRNLTPDIPKDPDEIEALLAQRSAPSAA